MFPTEPLPESIGAYKVLRRLAGLGSASMFLGRRDGPLGFRRICALKLVPNTGEGDPRFVEEIAREASICAKLNHPAIVRMFDFFEHDDQLVLVLEHVEGANLDRLLQHLIGRQQKLGDAAVFYLAYRIAGALAHAHAATDETGSTTPVIHRNLHPENIVIGWDGQVRLTGFGIGKIVGRTPDTVAGVVKGTPGYMSPEQARGERVTTKADVYGLGILLWSLLAGKPPPIDGTRPAAMLTVRPDLPRPVATLIDAALAPLPDGRKITCAEIEQTLAKVARPDRGKAELVLRIQSAHATIEVEDADPEEDRRPTIPVKRGVQTTRPNEITKRFAKDLLRKELAKELAAGGALEGVSPESDLSWLEPEAGPSPDRASKPDLVHVGPLAPLRVPRPEEGIESAGAAAAERAEAITLPAPSLEPKLVVDVKSEGWKPALPDRATFGRLFDAAKRASEREPQKSPGAEPEESLDEADLEEAISQGAGSASAGAGAGAEPGAGAGAALVAGAAAEGTALAGATPPAARPPTDDDGTLPSGGNAGLPLMAGARGTLRMVHGAAVEFGPPPGGAPPVMFGAPPEGAYPAQFGPPPELTPRPMAVGLPPGMLIDPTPMRHGALGAMPGALPVALIERTPMRHGVLLGASPQSSAPGLAVQVAPGAEVQAPSRSPRATSLLRSGRSLSTVGTVAVSAVTATVVAAVWIAVARRDRAAPVVAAPSAEVAALGAPVAEAPVAAPPPEAAPSPVPAQAPPAAPAERPAAPAERPAAPAERPAAEASAAPPGDLAALQPGQGLLTVGFPEPANVFVTGKLAGPANQELTVRCGRFFLRMGRPNGARVPEWMTVGTTVHVPCGGSIRVDLKPGTARKPAPRKR